MSQPKKHHFVPKSYLESFSDEKDFLHIYSKRTGLYRKGKASKQMVITNYYRQVWVPEGVDQNVLEKVLGSGIEPSGITALRKMGRTPVKLTYEDISLILVYLSFQRVRCPRQADLAKTQIESYFSQRKDSQGIPDYRLNESFRFDFIKYTLELFTPYFQRMNWELIEADSESEFITSDSPVTFINEKVIPPNEPGIALYGTMVVFPISTKILLIMKHPQYINGAKHALEAMSLDMELVDITIGIQRHKWAKDAVNKHNWCFYKQSQDVIAASSKLILEDTLGREILGHKT